MNARRRSDHRLDWLSSLGWTIRHGSRATAARAAGRHEANPMGGSSRDYYSDPRNIGRHVEESFAKHGVDMPDSVRQSIDSARSGEAPKGLDL